MKRLNILFSTTRQWNCGDEFILFGIRRLLDSLDVEYNPIIYNRHPSICPPRYYRRRRWSRIEAIPNQDNSFFLDQPGAIDYVIFAGSPEWLDGPRITPLLNFILQNRLRCAFLGVGISPPAQVNSLLCQVLTANCDLITSRDPDCYELVRKMPNAYQEVCPALFAAPGNRRRSALERIGIVVQTGKTKWQSIPEETERYCMQQFEYLEAKFPVTYVAHYIDEANLLRRQQKPFYYSGYSEDYPRLYDDFDLVVSTRVHGCGLAASLGIPSILIPHDGRYKTALGFKAEIAFAQSDLTQLVESLNISERSTELIAYRATRHVAFVELLQRHLTFLV